MSNLTAQQVYERTRGKDSPKNIENRNIKAFGKKQIAKKMK